MLLGSTFKDIKGNVYSKTSGAEQMLNTMSQSIPLAILSNINTSRMGWNLCWCPRVEDNDRFGTHTVGQGAIRYQVLPLTSVYANIGSALVPQQPMTYMPFLGVQTLI